MHDACAVTSPVALKLAELSYHDVRVRGMNVPFCISHKYETCLTTCRMETRHYRGSRQEPAGGHLSLWAAVDLHHQRMPPPFITAPFFMSHMANKLPITRTEYSHLSHSLLTRILNQGRLVFQSLFSCRDHFAASTFVRILGSHSEKTQIEAPMTATPQS